MRADTNCFSCLSVANLQTARGFGIALVLSSAAARGAQSQQEYSRGGNLPAMITNRGAVEQLAKEMFAMVNAVSPGDSVVRYTVSVSLAATDTHGRSLAINSPSLTLDSLAQQIDRRAELWRFSASVFDTRLYQTPSGVVNTPHLRQATLSLQSGLASPTHIGSVAYWVWGKDRARVDSIADRIEAFGRTWSTWRSPKMGEMIRTSLKLLALILIPLALGLRERRFAWVLYPTSLVVFAASYLVPFASLFADCKILGTP